VHFLFYFRRDRRLCRNRFWYLWPILGSLQCFPTSYYDGAVSPIYKFLDIQELVTTLIVILLEAIVQKYETSTLATQETNFLLLGLQCTYTQFVIFVRQQILWDFADSQAIAQFICPQKGKGHFQSFLCGSNCFPQNPQTIMMVPQVVAENMRCLKMVVRPYETKQFNSTRNHVTHIPVWGGFDGWQTQNYQIVLGDATAPLFKPDNADPNTPNIFDGTSGGSAVDFNNTPLMGAICSVWNAYMTTLVDQIASVTNLGGSGNGSPLLNYTRYVVFQEQGEVDVTDLPIVNKRMERFIVEREVDVPIPHGLERKGSVKFMKEKRRFYAPTPNSVYTERTTMYSGMQPITQTHKEYFPHLQLPVIELSPGQLPYSQQIQIATMEPFSLKASPNIQNVFATRGTEIFDAISDSIVGRAGKKSELAGFVETLANSNQGGFLGDLFSTVGSIANTIGL